MTVGSGRSREGDDEELALLLKLELIDGFEQRGPLPEEKISELLSTCEFAISAQDELTITKSGTFMAYAAHGLNILSCYADASKPEPLSLMISPEELLKGDPAGGVAIAGRKTSPMAGANFGVASYRQSNRASSEALKPIKLLLVSPCQGAYGGIEAFVLAVAAAVRKEPDFEVRVCFKKTKHFARQPSLKTMLQNQPVEFCERADKDLASAIRWADIVHLQNASPDVVALAKFFRKRLVLTIHNYMSRELNAHRVLWRLSARFADARWYNSQFVWDTWEGERKRSRQPEGRDDIDIAGRAGLRRRSEWVSRSLDAGLRTRESTHSSMPTRRRT